MNLNFLNPAINFLANITITPVLMLVLVFGFVVLLAFYHSSGLAEKVENAATWKKTLAFFFVSIVVVSLYYVFYKAGKFDEALASPIFQGGVNWFNGILKSVLK